MVGTTHRFRQLWPNPRAEAASPDLRQRRSIVGTLVRLDDDPLLLCDCADGATHTCS